MDPPQKGSVASPCGWSSSCDVDMAGLALKVGAIFEHKWFVEIPIQNILTTNYFLTPGR
jgi:hypothetical protein